MVIYEHVWEVAIQRQISNLSLSVKPNHRQYWAEWVVCSPVGSVWATYLWVKRKEWVVPCISCFQQCWSFSGCWMLAALNFQHQHLPVLYWLNFLRRVWRCYWVKLALGELMISVTPLCKAIPRWLAQIYLVAILYGFLNFCLFCDFRSWWPSF